MVGWCRPDTRVGTSGVPKGSVLGNVAFAVNDLATAFQSPGSFFADVVEVVRSSERVAPGRDIGQVLNWANYGVYHLKQEKALTFKE